MTKKVHMVLQGKGGVGKSFISSLIAQYKRSKGQSPLCIDTDPVNGTFAGYAGLGVRKLEIMEADEINPRAFDTIVEIIASAEGDVIIDNGASSFVPLSHYLITNEVPALLEGMGVELIIHTVITGGQAFRDTLGGYASAVGQFPSPVTFVVWQNLYWGPIEHEGKSFEQLKLYKDHKDRVSAIVTIPQMKEETFGRDISEMLQARRTFDEAIDMESLTIMSRQRLKIFQSKMFEQMDAAAVL